MWKSFDSVELYEDCSINTFSLHIVKISDFLDDFKDKNYNAQKSYRAWNPYKNGL